MPWLYFGMTSCCEFLGPIVALIQIIFQHSGKLRQIQGLTAFPSGAFWDLFNTFTDSLNKSIMLTEPLGLSVSPDPQILYIKVCYTTVQWASRLLI